MESDDGDEPEINHYAFMAKGRREERERAKTSKSMKGKRDESAFSVDGFRTNPHLVKDEKDTTSFKWIIVRLVVAFFFIAVGVVALWYSVNKVEHTTVAPIVTTPRPIIKVNPFVNQTTTSGSYYFERNYKNFTNETLSYRVPCQWYQDDLHQLLRYVVAFQGHEIYHEIFANATNAWKLQFSSTLNNLTCSSIPNGNYKSMINSFGTEEEMRFIRSARLEDHHDAHVYIFSGRNPSGTFVNRFTSPHMPPQMMLGMATYLYSDQTNVARTEFWLGTSSLPVAPNMTYFALDPLCKQ